MFACGLMILIFFSVSIYKKENQNTDVANQAALIGIAFRKAPKSFICPRVF